LVGEPGKKEKQEQAEEARRLARLARAEARRARQALFRERLTREILFAGEGVSWRLSLTETNALLLEKRGLPVLDTAPKLAAFLGIDMRALRWLTFHREVAATSHYRQFQIPKAKGGLRTISAPRAKLRAVQQTIREKLLSHLAATEQAQAFVSGRSTLTNASPHLKKAIVVKLDLQDFFGTITFARVRGFFEKLGYSGMIATLLGLLVTEAPRKRIAIDGKTWYVALGPRSLPQGAPTSPALTNQIARRLDARLAGYAKKAGWSYTRYADDLTFSKASLGSKAPLGSAETPGSGSGEIPKLLGVIHAVVAAEGFTPHPEKTFFARKGRQQRVTGIVVNEKPGLPRAPLRRFRAACHRVSKDGFKDEAERRQMLGYASYVKMVKPELGERLLEVLRKAASP
jgi:hypothetical protein